MAFPSPKPSSRTAPATRGETGLPSLSPQDILLCIRERALVSLVIAVIACALLGVHLLRQPRLFQAEARLLVDRNERVVDLAQVVDPNMGADKNLLQFNTYLAQFNSSAVVDRVVAALSLEEKSRALQPYLASGAPLPTGEDLDRRLHALLRGTVSAYRQGNTFFIGVRLRHRDPSTTGMLATLFAREFIAHLLDRNTISNNSAITFLRTQSEELLAKAEESERELQEYRESTGMVSLDESRNIVVERMKSLSNTATSARVELLAAEARLRQAETILAADGDPLELAATTGSSNLAAIQSQIDQLRTERATMAERYGARHPRMIDNQRSLEALQRLRTELIKIAISNLRNERDQALDRERQLLEQLAAAENESLRLDQMGIHFNKLRREAETNRATFQQLRNRLNETTVTAQLENSNLRLAEAAPAQGYQVEPDTKKIGLMLALLGLGLFVSYPIALELLFNRIRGWADVDNYLKLPLLAELPAFRKIPVAQLPRLISASDDETAVEAIRALYSQLRITASIEPPRSIIVTSTVPGEGKSFVASNLAEACATHGLRTLLIDTDLRRPTQHRAFGLPNDRGILRWIESKRPSPAAPLADPDLQIISCGENLHLLRTGGSTRRSTEILGSAPVLALFETLRQSFDLVIIDTPPAGIFPDALTLAEHAQDLVYVVRYNHVARPAVRRVVALFDKSGISIAGVVLNLMPAGLGSSTYYSGYGHYHSKYYKASS